MPRTLTPITRAKPPSSSTSGGGGDHLQDSLEDHHPEFGRFGDGENVLRQPGLGEDGIPDQGFMLRYINRAKLAKRLPSQHAQLRSAVTRYFEGLSNKSEAIAAIRAVPDPPSAPAAAMDRLATMRKDLATYLQSPKLPEYLFQAAKDHDDESDLARSGATMAISVIGNGMGSFARMGWKDAERAMHRRRSQILTVLEEQTLWDDSSQDTRELMQQQIPVSKYMAGHRGPDHYDLIGAAGGMAGGLEGIGADVGRGLATGVREGFRWMEGSTSTRQQGFAGASRHIGRAVTRRNQTLRSLNRTHLKEAGADGPVSLRQTLAYYRWVDRCVMKGGDDLVQPHNALKFMGLTMGVLKSSAPLKTVVAELSKDGWSTARIAKAVLGEKLSELERLDPVRGGTIRNHEKAIRMAKYS